MILVKNSNATTGVKNMFNNIRPYKIGFVFEYLRIQVENFDYLICVQKPSLTEHVHREQIPNRFQLI